MSVSYRSQPPTPTEPVSPLSLSDLQRNLPRIAPRVIRTPSPPRSPIQVELQETTVIVTSPQPANRRLYAELPPIPRLALPPPARSQPAPTQKSARVTPTSVNRPFRSKPLSTSRRRPNIERIDDRSAIALERVPRQREIQKRKKQKKSRATGQRFGRECKICQNYHPTLKHYTDHLKTRAHQRKVINKKSFTCNTCKVTVYSVEDYQRHLNSARHRSKQSLSQ